VDGSRVSPRTGVGEQHALARAPECKRCRETGRPSAGNYYIEIRPVHV
jgi:hypothetical protein